MEIDVTAEKRLLADFTKTIQTKRLLVVEGTRSQENLIYRATAPESERGIFSIAKELSRLECNFQIVESSSPTLDDAIRNSDIVIIYAHGEFGEDGRLQGWLDYKGKPYPGPGVRASAICLDKLVFKQLMTSAGLRTARFESLENRDEKILEKARKVGYPLMAKLRDGGSSIGITKIHDDEELSRWESDVKPSTTAHYLFEKYINGRFFTAGLIQFPQGLLSLPLLEVQTTNDFYDEETKLGSNEGLKPDFIVPANVNGDQAKQLLSLAAAAFKQSGCEGVARVDIMMDEDGTAYLLEINTIPGMSEGSNLTAAFKSMGFSYGDLLMATLRTAYLKGHAAEHQSSEALTC